MKKKTHSFLVFIAALLLMRAIASADYYSTNVSDVQWIHVGGTAGSEFYVGATPFTVTKLGIFDYGGDGLFAEHPVGIWNEAGTLIGSVSIAAGDAADLEEGFRWASLSAPLTLSANTKYTLGAFYDEDSGWWDLIGGVATIHHNFTFSRNLYINDNSGLIMPAFNYPYPTGWYGPSMAGQNVPIPAPAWLLGSGVLGLVALGRRRLIK